MPRIMVTTEVRPHQAEPTVLLDELVHSVHLSTHHASAQLIERLAWAIVDAEHAEASRSEKPVPARERMPARARTIRSRRAQRLAA